MIYPIYEAQISGIESGARPDSWLSANGVRPPADLVVSRQSDGTPASRYGDLTWDFSAYGPPTANRIVYLTLGEPGTPLAPEQLALLHDVRWLLFLLIWRRGKPQAVSSIVTHASAYKALASLALSTQTSIPHLLGSPHGLRQITLSIAPWHLKQLCTLIAFLHDLGASEVGFDVVAGEELRQMNARVQAYGDQHNQHAPLPADLYSRLLANLAAEAKAHEAICGPLLDLMTFCASNDRAGRPRKTQRRRARCIGLEDLPPLLPGFDALLATHGLEEFWRRRGYINHRGGLCSALTDIQLVAKLQIQAVTGMRDSEAVTLPYDCIREAVHGGERHYLLEGSTTKFNHGQSKRARWVTCEEGVAAVRLAQRVADAVYAHIGVDPRAPSTDHKKPPLFISGAYLPFNPRRDTVREGEFKLGELDFQMGSRWRLQAALIPATRDCDLEELESIDPYRPWRTEPEYQVGQPWPFRSHQLRRSLALYAQRSGLVSLPSLRRQLQHITEEMSRYYARGSAAARDIIGAELDHFGREWQEAGPLSSGLSYIRNVLESDDVMFGGHADWVDAKLRQADGTVLFDRALTLKRFKKGEIAFRETLLGGCTTTTVCSKPAVTLFDRECLAGCKHMVGKLKNLDRVIAAQTRFVSSLDSLSVEFRTEQQDLQFLLDVRARVLKRKEIQGEQSA